MTIRPAAPEDLPALLQLFAGARRFMAEHGNPNQWKATYPSAELLTADCAAGRSFVCEENGRILASFFFAVMVEPTYAVLTGGTWLNDAPYGVLHRIAVAEHERGVASFCLDWCAQHCTNLRADTHHDNIVMQHFLTKHGFCRCGIVHMDDGGERIAYQRVG